MRTGANTVASYSGGSITKGQKVCPWQTFSTVIFLAQRTRQVLPYRVDSWGVANFCNLLMSKISPSVGPCAKPFQPSISFVRPKPDREEHLSGAPLLANISLGWNGQAGTNTLA